MSSYFVPVLSEAEELPLNDSAVGIVARVIKLMKMQGNIGKIFESSTPCTVKKFSNIPCRLRRLITRSRLQLRNLG